MGLSELLAMHPRTFFGGQSMTDQLNLVLNMFERGISIVDVMPRHIAPSASTIPRLYVRTFR